MLNVPQAEEVLSLACHELQATITGKFFRYTKGAKERSGASHISARCEALDFHPA